MQRTLHTFNESKLDPQSRELVSLKYTLGGIPGTVGVGRDQIKVLKLGDRLYVTTEPIPRTIEKYLALDRADIHTVKSGGDMQLFVDRYRAFQQGLVHA